MGFRHACYIPAQGNGVLDPDSKTQSLFPWYPICLLSTLEKRQSPPEPRDGWGLQEERLFSHDPLWNKDTPMGQEKSYLVLLALTKCLQF